MPTAGGSYNRIGWLGGFPPFGKQARHRRLPGGLKWKGQGLAVSWPLPGGTMRRTAGQIRLKSHRARTEAAPMHTRSMFLGLICLTFCSCQRIVWTAKPVIENADKADLSLAGVWTRYKRPVDEFAADETIEVTGPDGAGMYHATTKGTTAPPGDFCTTFVASKLPDGSAWILLQVDLSRFAEKPCNWYAYGAVKDEWLFLRRIDSQKLTDVVKRENVPAVITPAGFSAEVSAEGKVLLRLFETHVKEITADVGVYRRVTAAGP